MPSTSDETGHSPADSGAAGISTPGSLSTTSSNEDLRRTGKQNIAMTSSNKTSAVSEDDQKMKKLKFLLICCETL